MTPQDKEPAPNAPTSKPLTASAVLPSGADDWPPGPDELLEDPELREEVRDLDPDYIDDLVRDYPELASNSGCSPDEEEA